MKPTTVMWFVFDEQHTAAEKKKKKVTKRSSAE
jgi:hypothetical protein